MLKRCSACTVVEYIPVWELVRVDRTRNSRNNSSPRTWNRRNTGKSPPVAPKISTYLIYAPINSFYWILELRGSDFLYLSYGATMAVVNQLTRKHQTTSKKFIKILVSFRGSSFPRLRGKKPFFPLAQVYIEQMRIASKDSRSKNTKTFWIFKKESCSFFFFSPPPITASDYSSVKSGVLYHIMGWLDVLTLEIEVTVGGICIFFITPHSCAHILYLKQKHERFNIKSCDLTVATVRSTDRYWTVQVFKLPTSRVIALHGFVPGFSLLVRWWNTFSRKSNQYV